MSQMLLQVLSVYKTDKNFSKHFLEYTEIICFSRSFLWPGKKILRFLIKT